MIFYFNLFCVLYSQIATLLENMMSPKRPRLFTARKKHKDSYTQGDLTQIFPTFSNPIVNLNFHMKKDPGLSFV